MTFVEAHFVKEPIGHFVSVLEGPYSLRTAARVLGMFAQNAPVLGHLLVAVLSPTGIVCDESWKMSYDE